MIGAFTQIHNTAFGWELYIMTAITDDDCSVVTLIYLPAVKVTCYDCSSSYYYHTQCMCSLLAVIVVPQRKW